MTTFEEFLLYLIVQVLTPWKLLPSSVELSLYFALSSYQSLLSWHGPHSKAEECLRD
jgi:hypothetical protein